ncbi:MAG: zf-HC2 domain-containing protein [Treponema sp.]|jgi:hypothetical protein|nr:zf-HC2 domain-containing protein [Treponema sp.]
MSSCPTKDIHSVYVDNELPEIYKAEYEEHVKNCPKCQKQLEMIKRVHEMMQNDSASISTDSHYLEQSFDRLKIRMNYSKNIKRNNSFHFVDNFKYSIPAIAAAAVFAIIIPLRMNTKGSAVSAVDYVSMIPSSQQSAQNISLNSGKGVVLSGNIPTIALSSVKESDGFIKNVDSTSSDSSIIKSIEVFRPDFNEDQIISIKITVPSLDSVPIVAEIDLPMNVISGQFN